MRTRHDRGLNPSAHGSEPSALPLSYPIALFFCLLLFRLFSLSLVYLQGPDFVLEGCNDETKGKYVCTGRNNYGEDHRVVNIDCLGKCVHVV